MLKQMSVLIRSKVINTKTIISTKNKKIDMVVLFNLILLSIA